ERLCALAGASSGRVEAGAGAHRLRALGVKWVYVKGGHDPAPGLLVRDHLAGPGTERTLAGPRIDGPTPRGTGCALSTLIAAGLAQGLSVPDAASGARDVVAAAIKMARERSSLRLIVAP